MESLKKKASDAPSTSGMFVIEVNTVSHDNLWVSDTNCGSHISSDMQGLRHSRKLNKGELDLCLGNGARVSALATGAYVLTLPSGVIFLLDDCFYVPVLAKNIIYVFYLNRQSFYLTFSNNSCKNL